MFPYLLNKDVVGGSPLELKDADFENGIDEGWYTEPGTADPTFNGFSVSGGRLICTFAADADIDAGTANGVAGEGAPRIVRDIPDVHTFTLYAKTDYDPMLKNAGYAGAGFYVEISNGSGRMDHYTVTDSNVNDVYVKIGSVSGGGTRPVPPGASGSNNYGIASHHRLDKIGDDYGYYISYDGSEWDLVYGFNTLGSHTISRVGFLFYQGSPPNGVPDGTVAKLDYLHFDTQKAPPLIEGTNDIKLTEDFTDLSNWDDGSIVGGSAVTTANELVLTCTSTDQSSGRVSSKLDFAENQGMVFTAKRGATGSSNVYLGAVLRGQSFNGQDWAGQYAPPLGLVYEANYTDTIVRLLRVGGPAPTLVDGAKFTWFYEDSLPANSLAGDGVRVRMEAVSNEYFRFKIWAPADTEPSAWQFVIYDGVIRGPGKVGFACSKNDGSNGNGSIIIYDVEVYEII